MLAALAVGLLISVRQQTIGLPFIIAFADHPRGSTRIDAHCWATPLIVWHFTSIDSLDDQCLSV